MNREQRRKAARRKPSPIAARITELEHERANLLGKVGVLGVKQVKLQNRIIVTERKRDA